jgi:hypothetical protein
MCGHVQQNHRPAPNVQTTRPNAMPHATPKATDPKGTGHCVQDGFEHPKAAKHHHHHRHHPVGRPATDPTVRPTSPGAHDAPTPKTQVARDPVITPPVAQNTDADLSGSLRVAPLKAGTVKRALG